MSLNATQLYPLVIKGARVSDAGNYTCVTSTSTGVWEQEWELLITEREATEQQNSQKLIVIVVGAVSVFVSCMIFVVTWVTVRACKVPTGGEIQPPQLRGVQEHRRHHDKEDIYENSMEINSSHHWYDTVR
ncbi:uncharacterized protein ACJ7VT_014563 [Polymixia lowei]